MSSGTKNGKLIVATGARMTPIIEIRPPLATPEYRNPKTALGGGVSQISSPLNPIVL